MTRGEAGRLETGQTGVYGALPEGLDLVPEGAIQLSPLHPGAESLEERAGDSLAEIAMLAPAGTIERRYAIALALKAVAPGGSCVILAPKQKGGTRLGDELRSFGCAVEETAKRHHRICTFRRPETVQGLDATLAEGAPRFIEALGLWSQPGVFSWDRIDPGSALLATHLGSLSGHGADLGCGIGTLALAAMAAPKVKSLALIDIDRRAIAAARRNVEDPRARFHWADALRRDIALERLDFVVMNPPFHSGGIEDQALGQGFIKRAAEALRKGGTLWLTANRHLPYEAVLKPHFHQVTLKAEAAGYKIFEARK